MIWLENGDYSTKCENSYTENVKNLCRKKVFFVVLYKIPYEAFLIAVDIKSLKQQHGS